MSMMNAIIGAAGKMSTEDQKAFAEKKCCSRAKRVVAAFKNQTRLIRLY